MKQVCTRTRAFLLAILILITSTGLCQPVVALETPTDTTSSSVSFADALTNVPDGGTIQIDGVCTLPSDFKWKSHGKKITVTGGTLDASAVAVLIIGDDVTFDNMTLTLKSGGTVYANGHKLVIKENVTVQNVATLYGGSPSTTVARTDITILSGTYATIYGGGNNGTVKGDVHAYIGGNVNKDINEADHDGTNKVFGGSKGGIIKGNVYLTFADQAKAHYLYGGSSDSATVTGGIYLNVTGGNMMSIYGGGSNSNSRCDIFATITGCMAEQVFGGSEAANHTGNITLRIFGGTITRRIYGGCYNNYGIFSGWGSERRVYGNITLIIGGEANITFSSSREDRAIYAKSRHKTDVDTGTCKLIFSDSSASAKYKNSLGAQDSYMKGIMSGKTSHSEMHTLKHEKVSDTVITESCISCPSCSHTVNATLALEPSHSLEYTGSAICPAKITYTGSWYGEDIEITYSNNINIGNSTATATAIYARNSITLTLPFSITKITSPAPKLTAVNETVQGNTDGMILGLTTEMEYSTDGQNFLSVTDPGMKLGAGTYLVRTAETDTHFASNTVTVTIQSNRHIIDLNLLQVKYQLPLNTNSQSPSVSPRLIASLDTLLYSKVGFEIAQKEENGEWGAFEAMETDVAYISIIGTVAGNTVTYTPNQEYGDGASYFFVQNTPEILAKDFDSPLRIRAYVVTQDGYTVYGNTAELVLADALS